MSVKIKKINLIPVSSNQEINYLLDKVMKDLKDLRVVIDRYGEKYDHDTPWKKAYLSDSKFYLYRVQIGAIGRINTCEDAARLGLVAKMPAKTNHFTSNALYYVYRIARQYRRQLLYIKKLNGWLNSFLDGTNVNSRFLEIYNMEIE